MKPGPKPKRPKGRGEPILAYPEGLTICPVCLIAFHSVRGTATFCSDSCRQRARVARAYLARASVTSHVTTR